MNPEEISLLYGQFLESFKIQAGAVGQCQGQGAHHPYIYPYIHILTMFMANDIMC